MAGNKNGFTLIEVLITLSLFVILGSIVFSVPSNIYHKILLKSTAVEIKEALCLSRQLSLDESKWYCVELLGDKFRVREYITGGGIVLNRQLGKNISKSDRSITRISHNWDGETSYGKFILVNKKGQKIDIEVLIGTGRIRISNIYD
ncbi:MAG: prepilin-type N-terminal cleavage/methylation domain-containing protein [Natronincolaceae bacterium]|nr:prepilin-type N-terminal cleavage/methylation domain-containing protein [Bacillota bacterium]NLK91301.1 prepilin-type N-terminal cleavage/methylation domain-containing protein [Clostridiales bacterium]